MSEREEYSGDFSAYLDGELSESRQRRLDEVLKYDRELAGELDRLRATRELIHSLPVEQPPRDFTARIVTRAKRMRLLGSLHQPRSYRWITLAAAAVVLVAAGLSVVIMQKLPWKQPADTSHDEVGRLALAPVDPDNGDVAKTYDNKVGKVATPGPGRSMKSQDPLESTLTAARRAAARLGKKGGGEADFVIYTSNLAFAQRDVEKMLVHNGIHSVHTTLAGDAVGNKDISSRMGRGNFFNTTQTTVKQVQYEVFVPPQQAVKLKNELNVIREQQDVSQAVTPRPAVEGDIALKAIQVAHSRTGTDAATVDEKFAGRKTLSKARHAPAPKSADDERDREIAVGDDAERIRGVKTERKPIAKGDPSPKTLSEKSAERPRRTAKPGPAGAAIAAQTGVGLPPAPVTTRPDAGTLAAKEIQEVTGELEGHAESRPDLRQRLGESFDSQKVRTAPSTAPAKAPKRLPSTQNALAIRQPVTSQRAEQAELQIRANVTRLLITLNLRGVRPPRSADALRKAASQEAAPAGKDNTNQSD